MTGQGRVSSPMRTLTLGWLNAWAEPGFYGVQVAGRQYDLRDHRRHRPLFSVRELGHYCGRHIGNWCIRTRRMKGFRMTSGQGLPLPEHGQQVSENSELPKVSERIPSPPSSGRGYRLNPPLVVQPCATCGVEANACFAASSDCCADCAHKAAQVLPPLDTLRAHLAECEDEATWPGDYPTTEVYRRGYLAALRTAVGVLEGASDA